MASERTLVARWKGEVDPSLARATAKVAADSEKAAKKTTAVWSGIGAAIGGAVANLAIGAVNALGDLAGEAIAASDATDKFKTSLNFAGLGTGAIEKVTKQARAYADQTVYGLGDIQNITAQLASNGVKNFSGLTEAAGNLNAVAGGNAETFKSVGSVLTQTAGAGKLTTENWNQLANAIPGASGQMQDALKKNGAYTGNFRKAMEKGQISSEEFNAALLELGSKPVAVEAAKSTKTFEGAIGGLQATIVGQLSDAFTAVKPTITDIINGLSDFVAKLADAAKWMNDNKGTLTALGAGFLVVAGGLAAVSAAQTIAAGGGLAKYLLTAGKATRLWAAAQAILNVVMSANPIALVVIAIAALVAGLVIAYQNCEEFRKVCDAAFSAIGAAGRWLWNNALAPVMRGIVKGFAWVIRGIADLLDAWGNLPGQGWAKDAAKGLRGVADAADEAADGIKDIPDPDVETDKAKAEITRLQKKIDSLKGKKVKAEAKGDTREVKRLQGEINRTKGKVVTIRTEIQRRSGKIVLRGATIGVQLAVANGALFFAGGGMRERHRAQIAPAGAWRVWAEPETGGEAYIPLATSKRRRSREIWWETGRRLGVIPYADGGVATPGGPGAASDEIAALLRQLLARQVSRDDMARLIEQLRAIDARPRNMAGASTL